MNSRASKRTDKGQQKQRYVAKQGPADHGGDESDDKLPSGAFALAIRTDGFPAGGGGGSGLTSRSSQIALGNIRRVLGSGFKPNDPAGYRDLLNRSFDLKTVDGHIEATWRPAGWNGKSSPVDLSPEWHVLHSSME